jgi:hypothetical protein
MVCIPAWSFYKLSTLKGPLKEVGGKSGRGVGVLLDEVGLWMTGGLSAMVGTGVQGGQ